MEKIKSVKGKSPISLLKFQQKSDFKKFLKFIQDQTKELKGVKKPKENKIKSALKVGAIGLGGLGIAGLFGAAAVKDKDDEFEKGKGLDEDVDLFAAIGRRNKPGIKTTPTFSLGSRGVFQKPKPDLFEKFDEGTRTSVTRGRSGDEGLKIKPGFAERRADELREKGRYNKRFSENYTQTKQLVKSGEVGSTSTIPDYMKKNIEAGKKIGKKLNKKKPSIKIDPLKIDPLEAFKSADESLLAEYLKAGDPEVEKIIKDASKTSPPPDVDVDDFFRGQKYLKNRRKPISRRFKNLREGVMGATDRDPSGRVTNTLSKRTFPEKGPLAKLTRMFINKSKNPKITRDNFLGMSYKGPKFSMLSKLVNNPAAKVVLFGLDLYNAIQSGKQIFNPKDNLAYSLYDLYVSINNKIFENDPEKLKIYRSESSDERILLKQFQRNMNIIERQNDVARQKFVDAQGTGSNNIIVVPQNQQNTNMSSGNNIPTRTGGVDLSLLPFEPLNIGDDILLHKLNQ